MPLPLIIGAAALATAAYGAKKGYDGYQKHSESDEIVRDSEFKYQKAKKSFDEQETETNGVLEALGQKEIKIGQEIQKFETIANELLEKLNKNKKENRTINIPKHQLEKIEAYSATVVGIFGTVAGAGVASAATGFAVYGGTMALGVASTGTAISGLSGAAATKATLAALGGGAKAAGGLGILGGQMVLGGAIAAPIVAIAGWAYDKHGEEALTNAKKIKKDVELAVAKLQKSEQLLLQTHEYAFKIKNELKSIFSIFLDYSESLVNINNFINDVKGRNVDVDAALERFNDHIITTIENGYAVAAIMVDIITTPIFKIKDIPAQEGAQPVMETDQDGLHIINAEAIDAVLAKNSNEKEKYITS